MADERALREAAERLVRYLRSDPRNSVSLGDDVVHQMEAALRAGAAHDEGTGPDLRAIVADALHDSMCDVSHHDRPPARCSRWPLYPFIAEAVAPRIAAAIGLRSPEPVPSEPDAG